MLKASEGSKQCGLCGDRGRGGLENLCDLELGPHFISQPQVVYFVTGEYRLTVLQGGGGLETA